MSLPVCTSALSPSVYQIICETGVALDSSNVTDECLTEKNLSFQWEKLNRILCETSLDVKPSREDQERMEQEPDNRSKRLLACLFEI